MTTSIRLLLEEFLGLMREEGELDVFLPLLLSAMGHEIVYRAQKGPRQYGVDILSIGAEPEGGGKKLFMWLVKRGNLGRTDWSTTNQSIRQSIEDVGDVYLRSHIVPQHKRLPKKLVVLTNGDFASALTETIAGYFERWSRVHAVETMMVNGSTLAAWAETFLLDEHLLPSETRATLRRMLVNVSAPELSVSFGRELVVEYLRSAKVPAATKGQTRKRLLVGLRGVRTALAVLYQWGASEENLTAPYRLSEYAVLAVWSEFHEAFLAGDPDVGREFRALLEQWCAIALAYHGRVAPFYAVQDAFSLARRDALLVSQTAFSELGRLGLQVLYWGFVSTNAPEAESAAHHYVEFLEALLQSHSCTGTPAFDRHAADIHVALLALLVANRRDAAKKWVQTLSVRLGYAASMRQYWPMVASFEDALSVRAGEADDLQEFMATSTLVPILLTWSAVLDQRDVYDFLRSKVLPKISGTTLNFWDAEAGYDWLLADEQKLSEHGVGVSAQPVPEQTSDFLVTACKPVEGVESIEKSAWYRAGLAFVPLMASLHWGLQIPREMLVRHAIALAGWRPEGKTMLLGSASVSPP
jgi:hypothetical protein